MKDVMKAAFQYVLSLKTDKEVGASEEETRSTTPIAIAAFIAGAEWQNEEFGKPPKIKQYRKIVQRNYCCDCEHFRPDEEGERKPVSELCKFVRPLIFKAPSTDDDFIFDYDWGFYLPGCKDFKKVE